jgi:RNA polymerase sigma-70 factor, ECF subfamily
MDPAAAFADALADALRGDERGFSQLWRSFNPPLLRYLRGTAGIELAEDVAAQTWLEVVRTLDHFDGDDRGFRSWLFTIARHRLVDARRAAIRKPESVTAELADRPTSQAGPAELAESDWSTADALALIGSLAPDQAEVVLLRVVGGLTTGEVADVMGKSEGAVRVLAHRGLKRLERILASTDFSSEGVTP